MERGLALLLLLAVATCRSAIAISVTVDGTECLQEYVFYGGDTVSGNFVVHEQGAFWKSENIGIDLKVISPTNAVVSSFKGTSGEKFEFKAPNPGIYKFCFHALSSTPDIVSFHVHVGHIPNEHDHAKDEHLDPVNVKIAQLREVLESVTAEQKYLKAREARHRHTNESTRKRLMYYTMTEYVALACASGLQAFYIKHMFRKSVAYNRV